MSANLIIRKKNEATITIECSSQIARELTSYFSCFSDNYRFHPKFKAKTWDGKLRFFTWENQLPIGLLHEVYAFCAKGKYTYEQQFKIKQDLPYETFKEFVDSLNIDVRDEHNNPVPVREYQLQAAYDAINEKHLNIESSTASGKSLIIYIIIRWLVAQDKKCLCVFPTTTLVEQIFTDFADYGWEEVENKCCMIYSGKKRLMERNIIFSTWQSMFKDTKELEKFDCMLVDEAHGQSGNSKAFSTIAKSCINAEYRIGLSGSYPDPKTADWFTTVGATGQIRTYSTYKMLQDAGYISNLKIYVIRLKYPNTLRYKNYDLNIKPYTNQPDSDDDGTDSEESSSGGNKFAMEADFVNNQECRNKFIIKLVQRLKGNTLVLFTKIEQHGLPLFQKMRAEVKDKMVMYIDGKVPVTERSLIKAQMEKNDNCVLAATYSTLSTGVNIKRIHNVIFVSGTKSKTRTIQSIGRGLRKHHTKEFMKLFDLVDDLSFKDSNKKIKYINFAVKHYKERLKIYQKNEFDIETLEYELKEG